MHNLGGMVMMKSLEMKMFVMVIMLMAMMVMIIVVMMKHSKHLCASLSKQAHHAASSELAASSSVPSPALHPSSHHHHSCRNPMRNCSSQADTCAAALLPLTPHTSCDGRAGQFPIKAITTAAPSATFPN